MSDPKDDYGWKDGGSIFDEIESGRKPDVNLPNGADPKDDCGWL
jgi:hypothetical protein